jgi:hypothetical protein
MSKRWVVFPIVLTLVGGVLAACTSKDDGGGDGEGGEGNGSGATAGVGANGSGDGLGGEEAGGSSSGGSASGGSSSGGTRSGQAGSGNNGEAGSGGELGNAGAAGSGGSANGAALPLDAFLYVKKLTEDHDALVARSVTNGEEVLVTDLTEDGSEGWEIWGHTLSPDRKTVVLASLFGPTKADNDTHLATRRLWSLELGSGDFTRLTPVFENTGSGRTNFSIDVQSPRFTADGSAIIYDFGNWWYEGTTLEGGSLPWIVSAQGGLPESFTSVNICTVVNPSVNPVTGDVLFVHSVCIGSQNEGIFLYPKEGSTQPLKLVGRGFGAGFVDPSLETASWLGDGSGFIFVASVEVTRGNTTAQASSLFLYEMESGDITPIVVPDEGSYVRSATIAPDGSSIVYCLQTDDANDLRLIDLTKNPAPDTALTNDGRSCDPAF